uniref:Uncharacterized protein n=1 Tax=Arundo donax TaxID=35708 RepID=A0A0A8ZTN1_ARUDO
MERILEVKNWGCVERGDNVEEVDGVAKRTNLGINVLEQPPCICGQHHPVAATTPLRSLPLTSTSLVEGDNELCLCGLDVPHRGD